MNLLLYYWWIVKDSINVRWFMIWHSVGKIDLELYTNVVILLLLIARKLTFEYDQMRVTSKIPKNYKQKQ